MSVRKLKILCIILVVVSAVLGFLFYTELQRSDYLFRKNLDLEQQVEEIEEDYICWHYLNGDVPIEEFEKIENNFDRKTSLEECIEFLEQYE